MTFDIFSVETIVSLLLLSSLLTFLSFFRVFKTRNRKIDKKTLELLTKSVQVPDACIPLTSALNEVSILDDEMECAAQLRSILQREILLYSTLEQEPELLLAMSKHVGENESTGALWTRFTVQYNLFAGSIVALGAQFQREKLYATQKLGELGCFAFTECGAGVLSGAAVETIANYDSKSKQFIIHSPTPSSRKKWISQGLYAEHAVILANLMVEDGKKNAGPHLFFVRIQNRELSGKMTPLPGILLIQC